MAKGWGATLEWDVQQNTHGYNGQVSTYIWPYCVYKFILLPPNRGVQ